MIESGPPGVALGVVHLVERLTVGGAETLAVRLANARAATGKPTGLYTLQPGGGLAGRIAPAVEVRSLDLARGSVRRPWSFLAGAVGGRRALTRRLAAGGVSVLQTHLPEANFWGLMLTWRRPCSVVATVHSNDEFHYGDDDSAARRNLRRRAYRLVIDRCDAVVAVSDSVRDSLIRELALSPRLADRIAVVPNGVEIPEPLDHAARRALRQSLDIPPDEPVLLGAGRLTALKNFDHLVAIAARLREAGIAVTTLIAGEGEEHDGLAAAIDQHGLAGRVRLLGVRDDLDRLQQIADVFVLPSRWEGLPLVLLEAMAAATPVVSYSIDGVVEVIEDGRAGLLAPPGDEEALARAVSDLLADPERRARLGTAGRALVADQYGLQRSVAALEEIYTAVATR